MPDSNSCEPHVLPSTRTPCVPVALNSKMNGAEAADFHHRVDGQTMTHWQSGEAAVPWRAFPTENQGQRSQSKADSFQLQAHRSSLHGREQADYLAPKPQNECSAASHQLARAVEATAEDSIKHFLHPHGRLRMPPQPRRRSGRCRRPAHLAQIDHD